MPNLSKMSDDELKEHIALLNERKRINTKRDSISLLETVANKGFQGVTAGFSDEIIAFLKSQAKGTSYEDEVKDQRETLALQDKKFPKSSLGAEMAGSVLGFGKVTAPAFAAIKGASRAARVLGTGSLFAAEGAVVAAGKAQTGQAENEAKAGAVLGTGTGLTTNMAMATVKNLGGRKMALAASGVLGPEPMARAMRFGRDTMGKLFGKAKTPTDVKEVIELINGKIPVTQRGIVGVTSEASVVPGPITQGSIINPIKLDAVSEIQESIKTGVPGAGLPRVSFPDADTRALSVNQTRVDPGFNVAPFDEAGIRKIQQDVEISRLRDQALDDIVSAVDKSPDALDVASSLAKGSMSTGVAVLPRGTVGDVMSGGPVTRAVAAGSRAAGELTDVVAAAGTGGTKDIISRAGGALGLPVAQSSLFSGDR